MAQIYPNQLKHVLTQRLPSVFFIYGGEPQQTYEAIEQIRDSTSKHGYNERDVFDMRSGSFSWEKLLLGRENLSLFSKKKLIEINIDQKQLSSESGKHFLTSLTTPTPDIIYLLIAKDIKTPPKSKWFNDLVACGTVISAKPITQAQFPNWLSHQLKQAGFSFSPETLEFFVLHTEGNLTAAKQLIEKLTLADISTNLTIADIQPFLSNQTEFSVYDLSNSLLAGDISRTFRILKGLTKKRVDIHFILWVITTEIRKLLFIKYEQHETPIERLFALHGIWKSKQSLVNKAIHRLSSNDLEMLMLQAHEVDKYSKQDEKLAKIKLEALCAKFADKRIFLKEEATV